MTDSEESIVGEAAVVIYLLEDEDIIAANGDKLGIKHPPELLGNINSFVWDPNLVPRSCRRLFSEDLIESLVPWIRLLLL